LGLPNPLVLLFLIGSGHNDALMIGLLVAGLAMARKGHLYLGIGLRACAGSIKAPGLIGVAAIAWTNALGESSTWRRIPILAKSAVITASTFEFFSLLFGVGWGWVHTLGASADVTNWITPSDLLASAVSHIANAAHIGLSTASLLGPAHLLSLGAAGLVGLWAFYLLPTIGLPRALGISLLTIVLLGPTLQPWYLAWGIAILAVTNSARITSVIFYSGRGGFFPRCRWPGPPHQ
jgi:alpha-1,6-mannosyltransferase